MRTSAATSHAQLVDEPKALFIAVRHSRIVCGGARVSRLSCSSSCRRSVAAPAPWSIRPQAHAEPAALQGNARLCAGTGPQGVTPSFPDDDKEDSTPVEVVNFALTVPLIVEYAASVRNSIRPDELDREVARVRRALYFDLGVPFPGINLRLNENLKDGEYRILVNEIPVAAGTARPGFVIVARARRT